MQISATPISATVKFGTNVGRRPSVLVASAARPSLNDGWTRRNVM
ncbi:hypothetical protein [Burkholderia plantarii]|nr:hypothetical protein [Burkholderia plantarii]